MSVLEKVSYNISSKLGRITNKDEDEIEVMNYGLFMAMHTLLAIILTLIVGVIIGRLKEVVLISIVAASLKRCSGGVHATSANRCLIIGIITSLIFTYICLGLNSISNLSIFYIFTLINLSLCSFIFYKKAPMGNKNKPLNKESTRKKLRKQLFRLLLIYYLLILLIIVLINYKIIGYNNFIFAYCIEFGVLLQCIGLTKVGESTILKLDSILKYNIIRGI